MSDPVIKRVDRIQLELCRVTFSLDSLFGAAIQGWKCITGFEFGLKRSSSSPAVSVILRPDGWRPDISFISCQLHPVGHHDLWWVEHGQVVVGHLSMPGADTAFMFNFTADRGPRGLFLKPRWGDLMSARVYSYAREHSSRQ